MEVVFVFVIVDFDFWNPVQVMLFKDAAESADKDPDI